MTNGEGLKLCAVSRVLQAELTEMPGVNSGFTLTQQEIPNRTVFAVVQHGKNGNTLRKGDKILKSLP